MAVASIHSLASEDPARAEAFAWSRFSAAQDTNEFCSSWLAVLCAQIERVSGGLLLLGPDGTGAFSPAAVWPDSSVDVRHLGAAAERVLAERRGVLIGSDGQTPPSRDQSAQIGYPIEVAGALRGAVVLEIGPSTDPQLQRSLRSMHWGSVWLVDRIRQRAMEEDGARLSRMALATDLVATAVKERSLSTSALSIANELAVKLKCDRVAIGIERNGSIELIALSHTAVFNPRMGVVRLLVAAMEEVLDLDVEVVVPPLDGAPLAALAHAELARDQKAIAICSAPLRDDNRFVGVMTLERTKGAPFDAETVELCETVAALLAPIVALKLENERGIVRRLRDVLLRPVEIVFGRGHAGAKLIALVAAGLTIFFSLYTTTYRVAARAVVEGAVQRAAVSPFDGHIAESDVRAGDLVRAGQVLCRLDDRDLKLELARLTSDREQARGKHRQALASQDRGAMMILAAQIAELDAQIGVIEDRVARATLVAPFDGVVVSGDLSQLLDTPVEQGKLLFEIAPLDSYRVILEVDERDIAALERDQTGELLLSGLPGQPQPFAVQQITPVSTTVEGRNVFRVEAHLLHPINQLRPGMEGVGKVAVGERRLIWIWTHSLFDWLRVWAWKQLP